MCMRAKLNVARVDSTHAQIRLMCWITIRLIVETDSASWNNLA